MKSSDEQHQQRAERLREVGLKATATRMSILRALDEDRRHPSAEMLFETMAPQHPTLSISTVYSTLDSFLKSGLIRRIGGAPGKLRVDGTVQNHDHAICRRCGDVFDVSRDLFHRPETPPELPDGLKVTNLHIEYEVVCSPCGEDG